MNVPTKAQEAAELIDRLERLVRASEQAGDLNPAQWEVLRYLARANRFSRTPAALAEYLAATRGTISRSLASLEVKGYVVRNDNPRDGRSVEFVLSVAGQQALARDPLHVLAADLAKAAGADIARLRDVLVRALEEALVRNKRRPFGLCQSCRHFRPNVRPMTATPHHCALLDQPLSEDDSRAICAEQEPAV